MENANPENNAPETNAQQEAQQSEAQKPEKEQINEVVIHMWPKTPVLYPVAIFALICCIVSSIWGVSPQLSQLKQYHQPAAQEEVAADSETAAEATTGAQAIDLEETTQSLVNAMVVDRVLGIVFLLLLAFTLFTLTLDIEVRWALVSFTSTIIVLLLIYILDQQFNFLPDLIPRLFELSPMATPQFYLAVFIIWVVLMVISMVVVRFHYVKVESNEVIVVGGILQREQRYSTINMRYMRDIQDVFEYYLPFVNSGRLILSFQGDYDSVVIDNVMNIDKVTEQLDELTGYMQVR